MDEVVQSFFSGSASNLVKSLLGSQQITTEEVKRMRRLLDEAARTKRRRSRE